MFSRDHTIWILVIGILAALVYNVGAALYWQPGATISETTLYIAQRYPLLPLLIGILLGHLFWPQCPAGTHPADPGSGMNPHPFKSNLAPALSPLLILAAASSADAAPQDAVVRLPSHGASATVIRTGPARSLILGCAHAFEGNDASRRVVIDAPTTARATATQTPGRRLLAVDYDLDLSLIEVDAGPLDYVAPVAPIGYRPGPVLLSVGYDKMTWPAVEARTELLGSSGGITYTRQRPVPGRSGGALIDPATGYVVGVCQGFEVNGYGRGMYVSHDAILAFLARLDARSGIAPLPVPRENWRVPRSAPFGQTAPPWPSCPNGRCPLQR